MAQCPVFKSLYRKIRPNFLMYSKRNYSMFIRARYRSQSDKEYITRKASYRRKFKKVFGVSTKSKLFSHSQGILNSILTTFQSSGLARCMLLWEFVISLNQEQQIPLEAYCPRAESPHLETGSKNTASGFSNEEVITKLQHWKGY